MRTTGDLVSEIAEELGTALSGAFWLAIDGKPFMQGTPIELVLGAHLFAWTCIKNMKSMLGGGGRTAEFYPEPAAYSDLISGTSWPLMAVWYQVRVGQYTADFILRYVSPDGSVKWIAVEADGHDFHEKTKEQAAHDKARDRHFQSSGLAVFRYAGSEIWRDVITATGDLAKFCSQTGKQ